MIEIPSSISKAIKDIAGGESNEVILEINGKPYSGFISASVSKAMDKISGVYSFQVSALDNLNKFPIKLRSKCRVLVNKKPFMTGYVEKVDVNYSANDHSISISGRDKTCDIIDSTLGAEINFSAGISLPGIIESVLKSLSLENDIKVINEVDNLKNFDSTEINNLSSQIGESAFAFVERYAKKRQVLIMSNGDGNIVLARTPKDEQKLKTVLTLSPKYQATILESSVSYDDTKRFYKYILHSQSNPLSNIVEDTNFIDNEKMVSVKAIAYDEDIRKSRIYNFMQHEDSYNSTADLQDRANWQANFNRATGFTYSITVQGFTPISDPKTIWQPNQLIVVNDEFCDTTSKDGQPLLLLIKSVKFDYSLDGSKTTLELIDKDGYSVEVLQGIKYRNKKKGRTAGSNVISDLSSYQKL